MKRLSSGTDSTARFRDHPVAWLILILALSLRIYATLEKPLLHDEEHSYIPFAQKISLWPGHIYLPIRETQHAALPLYIARAGTLLVGENHFGFRLGSLVMGMATIVLVYRAGRLWNGLATARWAAFLLAVNEYHIATSATATELGPQLFFVALAIYAALKFFAGERAGWLYLGAAACGLGFLCREAICLLMPIWFLAVLLFPERRWLLRKEPWLAAGLFLVVILPDILFTSLAPVHRNHQLYANYADHFSRFAGLGFNVYPTWFYLRDVLRIAGQRFTADFNDMPTMNLAAGLLLLAGSAVEFVRRRRELPPVFLALAFWLVYLLFSLMLLGDPRRDDVNLDDRVFHTVDITLIPGALLAGAMLARLSGRWQQIATAAAGLVTICVAYRLGWLWP